MAKVRIVSAIASKHGITLYLEDGQEKNLPTTSWRTKAVLDDVLARLARKEIVEIDLDSYSIEARVAEKTGGLLRFVRKTKSAVAALFGKKDGETGGIVVVSPADPTPTAVLDKIAQASPVPDAVPVDPTPAEPETELVAVVTDEKTGEETVIPGVAALEKHIEHAVMTNTVKGLQRFMERLADVSKKRSHTAQELLRFMERGDLPIADDGSIVAYKVLKTKNESNRDLFVDCHTSRVEQRVGSLVMQDESLIDQNRRNECSTGLHIARRGYLGKFSGDVITIVKVAPEDVVAVPPNEPDKMRAAAYHIVGRLPNEVHATLRSNQPMTDNVKAAAILADVIAGNHVGVLSRTRITSASGGSFTIEKVADAVQIDEGKSGFTRALDAPVEGLTPKEIAAARDAALAATPTEPVSVTQETPLAAIVEQVQEATPPVVEARPAPSTAAGDTPTETKAERDARRKREKRAEAAKARVDQIEAKTDKEVAARPIRHKAPAPANQNQVPEKYREAFELFTSGQRSQRQLEKEFNISAKTIRRLVRDFGSK